MNCRYNLPIASICDVSKFIFIFVVDELFFISNGSKTKSIISMMV